MITEHEGYTVGRYLQFHNKNIYDYLVILMTIDIYK